MLTVSKIAIGAEITAAATLKDSEGLSKPGPTIIVIVDYVPAFFPLGRALKTIDVGIAYAIQAGLGTEIMRLGGVFRPLRGCGERIPHRASHDLNTPRSTRHIQKLRRLRSCIRSRHRRRGHDAIVLFGMSIAYRAALVGALLASCADLSRHQMQRGNPDPGSQPPTREEEKRSMASKDSTQKQFFRVTDNVPEEAWYWAAVASILASAGFKIARKDHWALFVGQWPPTFIVFALYHRLLRPSSK